MHAPEPCPICGEGHVTVQVQMVESDYKGHKAALPLHFRLCDTCTSDFAGAAESKLNKQDVEEQSLQLFGIGVKALDKMQASQLIEELLEKTGKQNGNGQRRWSRQPARA